MNAKSILKSVHAEKWLRTILVIMIVISIFGFSRSVSAGGSTRISGVGFFAEEGDCTDEVVGHEGEQPDFANNLTGDLEGCLYVFVQSYECRPSGTYIEEGYEIYVGSGAEGDSGSFETTYKFTGKFDDCPNLAEQVFGRCQHPIVAESGFGDYEGAKGRLDFKDDVEAGNFPYTGNLKTS